MGFGLKFGLGLSGGGGTSGPPMVANQTVSSGRLTLALGDFLTATNGAITNTGGPIDSITLGTNTIGTGAHWSSSGVGIQNDSVPSDVQYVWTGCTATGPGGTSDTFTLTINTEADTYSYHDDTSYDAVMALSDATLSGKTAKGRSNTYSWTNANLNNRAFTSRFIVDSYVQYGVFFSEIGQKELRAPTNLTLKNLKLSANFRIGIDSSTAPFMVIKNTVDGFVADGCEFAGNWKDIYDPDDSGEYGWFGLLGKDGTTSITGGGFAVRNCTIHGGARGINFPGGTGTDLIIENNQIFDFRTDGIVFGHNDGLIIRWNDIYAPLGSPSDVSHGDFIQCVPNANTDNVKIYGNRLEAGRDDGLNSRELYQGIFMEDITTSFNYIDTDIFGNLIRGVSSHGISLYNANNSRIVNNTAVINTDWASSSTNYPRIRILQHESGTADNNLIADNISFAHSAFGTNRTLANNQVADPETTGQSDSYDTLFDGPDFTTPDTIAKAMVAFASKSGSVPATSTPRIGAIGGGYVDYDNRIYDLPRINPTTLSGDFTDDTGVTVSTLTTVAAPIQITNVDDSDGSTSTVGALIELSGGNSPELRVTSDLAGLTVITDWTSSNTLIAENHYLWLRDTASSQGEKTTTITAGVGDQTVDWAITTAASDVLTIAVLTEGSSAENLTQYTFDAGIREADEGKVGSVIVGTDATNGPAPSSVTIGGASAVKRAGNTTNGSIDGSCTIWSISIPASATSDVVVNYSGAPGGCAVQPSLLSNADSEVPTDTLEVLSGSQGTSINGGIDGLEDGGLLLGAFSRDPFTNGVFTGSAAITEDAEISFDDSGFVAGSREETTARTNETITYTAGTSSWHHMVGASWDHSVSFTANAVTFDGTNDWLDYGSTVGVLTDGKVGTFSFWAKIDTSWPASNNTIFSVVAANANTRFNITTRGDGTNRIRVLGRNSAETTILSWDFDNHPLDQWFHVICRYDLATADDIDYYLDGSVVAGTKNTFTNDNIDYTEANCEVGSANNGGSLLGADVSELWVSTAQDFDITVQANREKFRSSGGKPVSLGSDGSTPTGTQPEFYHTGTTATWHTNSGSVTGATENGALTDASTSPSD